MFVARITVENDAGPKAVKWVPLEAIRQLKQLSKARS